MECEQVEPAGDKVHPGNQYNAKQHLYGTGAADKQDNAINNVGYDQDINNILPSHAVEKVEHLS